MPAGYYPRGHHQLIVFVACSVLHNPPIKAMVRYSVKATPDYFLLLDKMATFRRSEKLIANASPHNGSAHSRGHHRACEYKGPDPEKTDISLFGRDHGLFFFLVIIRRSWPA